MLLSLRPRHEVRRWTDSRLLTVGIIRYARREDRSSKAAPHGFDGSGGSRERLRYCGALGGEQQGAAVAAPASAAQADYAIAWAGGRKRRSSRSLISLRMIPRKADRSLKHGHRGCRAHCPQ